MEEELDPDDNLCDDNDQLDFSNLNIPNDRFNIRNKEENKGKSFKLTSFIILVGA